MSEQIINIIDDEEPFFPEEENGKPRKLDALLRCGCAVRGELRRRLHALLKNLKISPPPAWFMASNCHAGNAYDDLWLAAAAAPLPALIADTGFGDFTRQLFQNRFLRDYDVFARQDAAAIRPEFRDAGLVDPFGLQRVFGANVEVMLIDDARLNGRPAPRVWEDILHPRWRGEIITSGSPNDLFDALLFATYRDFGESGLTALGANIGGFMHPAEMARLCGSDSPRAGTIYLLPAFFAAAAPRKERARVFWPEDGAWLTPQYYLRQNGANAAADTVANFLTGAEWAARLDALALVPARAGSAPLPGKLRWVGWDFVRNHDLEALRPRLNAAFAKGTATASAVVGG
jgi:ABC-type Fe3+ transport system substrate-binding protein